MWRTLLLNQNIDAMCLSTEGCLLSQCHLMAPLHWFLLGFKVAIVKLITCDNAWQKILIFIFKAVNEFHTVGLLGCFVCFHQHPWDAPVSLLLQVCQQYQIPVLLKWLTDPTYNNFHNNSTVSTHTVLGV